MADPGIFSSAGAAAPGVPDHRSPAPPPPPLHATPNPPAPTGWSFSYEYDPDAPVLQLRSSLPAGVDVLHVGTLLDLDAAHLLHEFRCIPVLLQPDLHAPFYHGFCKHYLWPLLHYLLPLSPTSLSGLRFDLSL